MAKMKTTPTDKNVLNFLNTIENDGKRKEAITIMNLMKKVTGENPKMWGDSIVGFGSYHYKYKSGREGDWFLTGFSPRKQNFSIYIMAGFSNYENLMEKLGTYKTGKSCLYVKRLNDIDLNVLTELIRESVKYMNEKYE
jgi:hypothetical protein